MITKIALELFGNPAKNLTPEESENLKWYHDTGPDADLVAKNRTRGMVGAALGAAPGAIAAAIQGYKGNFGRAALGALASGAGAWIGHGIGVDKYSPESAKDIAYLRANQPSLDELRKTLDESGFDARTRRQMFEKFRDDERERINAYDTIADWKAMQDDIDYDRRRLMYDSIYAPLLNR